MSSILNLFNHLFENEKNNLEQFEKTFGALTVVNVATIRGGRGMSVMSRVRAGSNASNASSQFGGNDRNGVGITDPRQRLSSLASDRNAGYGSSDEDRSNHPKIRNRRSSQGGANKLALRLRKSLRDLVFQNSRHYINYYQKSQGFQSEYKYEENKQRTETYNDSTASKNGASDNEYYEHDDEDLGIRLPGDKKTKLHHAADSFQNKIQMSSNVWKKSKKEKVRHPVVECEGMNYQLFLMLCLCSFSSDHRTVMVLF